MRRMRRRWNGGDGKNTMRDPTNGRFATVHGMTHTRIYGVWCAMKERCSNPHTRSYARYGGRGISVCQEWMRSFPSFYEWARNNGYEEHLTIDRIDPNGNYCPENCRWVTTAQQNRNYSRNRFLTYNGETLCLKDMAAKYGVNRATVEFRLKSGKTVEQALSNVDGRSLRWKK